MLPKIHIVNEIRKELNVQQRSIRWLADETGCDRSKLSRQFNRSVRTDLLYRISVALGKDFFAFYSQSLSAGEKPFLMQPAIHTGDAIRKRLNAQKRSITWLADETDCDRSKLSRQLNRPHICTDLLHRISVALGVDFFALYSQALSAEKRS